MSPYFHIMPVDKSTITTVLRIHPDLPNNPNAFISSRKLALRTVRLTKGRRSGRATWNMTLDVLTYRGIKVKLVMLAGDPLATATIEFNPGVCLYGHNGRILSLSEFLDALAILVKHLTPLLLDQADWIDLVPGLRRGGHAYWSFLEVLFQCRDTDGVLLAWLRHLRHPKIRTSARHWLTSIEVGGKRSNLRLSIYHKAVEMVNHGKLEANVSSPYDEILRLEARMKEDKLVKCFGNGRNVEVIDGVERLVSFYPQDLVRGHRTCFSELEGVFAAGDGAEDACENKPIPALGKLLAMVALDPRSTQTLPQLLSHLKHYTGASSKTICEIRDAGMAELSRRSTISCDELFSDAAYRSQNGIASMELEQKICHRVIDTMPDRLIIDTYSPPGQPPDYIADWPSYCL